jgi:amino acid permease
MSAKTEITAFAESDKNAVILVNVMTAINPGSSSKYYDVELASIRPREKTVVARDRDESLSRVRAASSVLMDNSTRLSVKWHPKQPTNSPTLTIFLLLNSMLGSGMLNQPAVFHNSGVIGGIVLYIIAAFANWYGLALLTAAGIEVDVLEYGALANKAFGKWGESMVDFSIVIMGFGGQLGYIIIAGFGITDLLQSWGCNENSLFCSNIFVTLITVSFLMLPLCCFRHFGHLGFISLISIAATIGVAFLVWAFGPYQHVQQEIGTNYRLYDTYGSFSSLGSIVFALSYTSANFQGYITTESEFQNEESWKVITGISTLIGALICASVGLIGYISFENETDGNILENFTAPAYDVFKILMYFHLILYVPVNVIILRYSLVKIVTGFKSEDLEFSKHLLITFGIVGFSTGIVILLIAFGYTGGVALSLILNITGGIGGKIFRVPSLSQFIFSLIILTFFLGSIATFIMPAAIYWKLMSDDSLMYRESKILMILGFVIMVVVVVFTILSLF